MERYRPLIRIIIQKMKHMKSLFPYIQKAIATAGVSAALFAGSAAWASSHREAPLIANDPLADNVDVYAFRSPDDTNMVTIIATYVPIQLPHGGPNYFSFGTNIRYEIHIENDGTVKIWDPVNGVEVLTAWRTPCRDLAWDSEFTLWLACDDGVLRAIRGRE